MSEKNQQEGSYGPVTADQPSDGPAHGFLVTPASEKKKPRSLLLLHGPNLNMLGRRDPTQYGNFTLADVESLVRETASRLGYGIEAFQSNHEGALIDCIHRTMDQHAGILINAGALTHYSHALRDALELCGIPAMEIHISDIHKREPFRQISVIQPVCCGQIAGFGLDGYRMGTEQLIQVIESGTIWPDGHAHRTEPTGEESSHG